ncbi:hypothetical protein [Chromobacterium violaceum]|uniref:hypothetical protein n=1 Tax=Chromobacterium violaceum TaxID=536 RepID=UPI0015FA504F|nr:hypothetical protein [Chromobacterium violaceum]MBA8734208.1 hypothetical protein [Chromobacterium violaceum]
MRHHPTPDYHDRRAIAISNELAGRALQPKITDADRRRAAARRINEDRRIEREANRL